MPVQSFAVAKINVINELAYVHTGAQNSTKDSYGGPKLIASINTLWKLSSDEHLHAS